MKRKLARFSAAVAIAFPLSALALGMGNLKVRSALNEPLNAEIALLSVAPGEAEDIKVNLAATGDFTRAGMDRPYVLSKLRFRVEQDDAGTTRIRVTSSQPIREPFLNFLLEINWPKGRLLREYTVLLDPPVYGAAVSAEVKGPVVRARDAGPGSVADAPDMAGVEGVSVPAAPAPARYSGERYGPVQANETLWSIAGKVRPDGSVSIQQTMLALLRANPDAFVNGNINALKAGHVLRVPSAGDAARVSQQAALDQVREQHALWNEYRQGLSAAVPRAPAEAVMAPAEPAAPRAAAPDSRLRVVSPGTGEAGVGAGGELAELRDRLALIQEELDSKANESREFQSRMEEAESLLADMQRLVQLKDTQLAMLQARLGSGETQATEPVEPEPVEPEAVEPAAPMAPEREPLEPVAEEPPRAAPERQAPILPQPAPPPTSFMDRLPVSPWVLGGGLGALALIGGGIAYMLRRRKSEPEQALPSRLDEDYGEDETVVAADEEETTVAPVEAPEPEEAEDTTQVAAPVASQAPAAPEEDPLAEVNVYLAYERFDQAEELVRKAIEQYPDRHEYRLKMLEIHYAAKDKDAFEREAAQLRDAVGGDSPMMAKAAGWWQDLVPDRELFAQAEHVPSAFEETHTQLKAGDTADLATAASAEQEAGEIDFDLGLTTDESAPEPEAAGGELDLDFSLETEEEAGADAEEGLDFDLGLETEEGAPEGEEGLDFELDVGEEDGLAGTQEAGLDFDLEAGETKDEDAGLDFALEPEGEAAEAPEADAGLEFDLEPSQEGAAKTTADVDTAPLDFDLESDEAGELDIGLDQGEVEPEAAVGELDIDLEPVDLEATGSEAGAETLDMDLDIGLEPETAPADEAAEAAAGDSEKTMDIGLDMDLEAVEAEQTEADDTALDFDLGVEEIEAAEEPSIEPAAAGDEAEIDFDLGSAESADEQSLEMDAAADEGPEIDFDLDLGMEDEEPEKTLALGREMSGDIDEIGTKLDLAQAYIDMGDTEGARGILNEVVNEGSDEQKAEAAALLDKLS